MAIYLDTEDLSRDHVHEESKGPRDQLSLASKQANGPFRKAGPLSWRLHHSIEYRSSPWVNLEECVVIRKPDEDYISS